MGELVFFQDVVLHRARADALFVQVQAQLRAVLPRAIVVHVGSTSLPDGLTKGDVDVQVRVTSEDFQKACDAVSSLYEENPGGFTDQGRSFKSDACDPPLGVHVTVIGGPSDIQHRQRDLLAARSDLRAAYDALKRTFDGKEMDTYREAKARFFDRLLAS